MSDAIRPVRLRLSRRPGANIQRLSLATNGLPAIVVARPSRWGNPFPVDCYGHKGAVDRFRRLMAGEMSTGEMSQSSTCTSLSFVRLRGIIRAGLPELRGKNLACWCALDAPCHGDTLLRLANPGIVCDAPETGAAAS